MRHFAQLTRWGPAQVWARRTELSQGGQRPIHDEEMERSGGEKDEAPEIGNAKVFETFGSRRECFAHGTQVASFFTLVTFSALLCGGVTFQWTRSLTARRDKWLTGTLPR